MLTGVGLLAVTWLTLPVALIAFAQAWIIPELYAFRGASVLRPKGARHEHSEPVAQGLLGDLLGHDERELQRAHRPGAPARRLGVWMVGEAGAIVLPPDGKRAHCFCVRVTDPDLPPSDRVAHLLLALRTDETGFATVANHAFAGAPWRVRRRLPEADAPGAGRGRAAWRSGVALASPPMAWNVVIAGGGFGGLYAARRLERKLPAPQRPDHAGHRPELPALHAAAARRRRRLARAPARGGGAARGAGLGRAAPGPGHRRRPGGERAAASDARTSKQETLRYDQLIVALGSVSRVLPIPGLSEYGLGFKSLADAIDLRNRVILHLETAEAMEDPEERTRVPDLHLRGRRLRGPGGHRRAAGLRGRHARPVPALPHGRHPLDPGRGHRTGSCPRCPASLAAFAQRELRGRGLEILTDTRLERSSERTARLSTGEDVPTRFVCWTAGVKPPAVMRELGLPLTEHGRIQADATARVPGHDNVWAIGDAAAVPDPANKGKPSPPTAQHVIRQGRVVGDNVAATLSGGKLRKFRYRTLGVFVDMGQHKAVATMLGVRLRGFPAWFAARTYHVAAMPGQRRGGCGSWSTGPSACCSAARRRSWATSDIPPRWPSTARTTRAGASGLANRKAWLEPRRPHRGRRVPATAAPPTCGRRSSSRARAARDRRVAGRGRPRPAPTREHLARQWERRRPLVEFVSAQEGSFVLAERDGRAGGLRPHLPLRATWRS